MLTVVHHKIKNPETAFARGERLMRSEGAPSGTRVMQFYPSQDGATVTCLWQSQSVESIQDYVDSVLGDSSDNTCYQVDATKAFAETPSGLQALPSA
jgi:hypothetical protein